MRNQPATPATPMNLPMDATPTFFMLPPNIPPVIRPADAVILDAGDPAMVPSDRSRRPVRFFSHYSGHVKPGQTKNQSNLARSNQNQTDSNRNMKPKPGQSNLIKPAKMGRSKYLTQYATRRVILSFVYQPSTINQP